MENIFTAKIRSKGQVTIPIEIRDKLNLKQGDNIVFVKDGNGYMICNSSTVSLRALKKIQDAFKGEAEKANLKDENDVAEAINKISKDK